VRRTIDDHLVLLFTARRGDLLAEAALFFDTYAHRKFIAFSEEAQALLKAAGIASELDEGCIRIKARQDATDFITTCGKLRHWDRERSVDLDA
jgi:catalase